MFCCRTSLPYPLFQGLIARTRIYSILVLKKEVEIVYDIKRTVKRVLDSIASGRLRPQICASFLATSAQLLLAENEKRKFRNMPGASHPSSCWEYLLTPKQQSYLRAYETLWLRKHRVAAASSVVPCLQYNFIAFVVSIYFQTNVFFDYSCIPRS